MSKDQMLELVEDALRERGNEDKLIAAGQFSPRGHSGGAFIGGLIGSDAGSAFGEVGEAAGMAGGFIAGQHAADAASGLPQNMLVGVSATTVYGFAAATRHSEPTALVFQLPRSGLSAKVHQRVNVRVLELIDKRQRLAHRSRGQPSTGDALEGCDRDAHLTQTSTCGPPSEGHPRAQPAE